MLVKCSTILGHNRGMARKKSSNSLSRSPVTSPAAPELPDAPVRTKYSQVHLEADRDNARSLTVFIDNAPSSFIDLDNPVNVGFEYMEIMLAALEEFPPGPIRVVHLGAAGCTMARAIEHVRPNSRQIGVDIDGELLEYARSWFDLPRAPRLRLRTGDARAELARMRDGSADVIIRDVFDGTVTPEHLITLEFTMEALRVLRPGGMYLINCADRPPLTHARREIATLWQAQRDFRTELESAGGQVKHEPDVALISEPALLKGRRYGNLVLALVKPLLAKDPQDCAQVDATEPKVARQTEETAIDLDGAQLGRRLRSLAVPAQIASGADSLMFARNAPVLRDPAPSDPAGEAHSDQLAQGDLAAT